MAAKIPQDVTREDRLVGPLTLRQFLYILGGGSLIFIAYQYYSQQYLYFIEFASIGLLVAALTLALAFATINGRPFAQFMMYFFRFLFSPKQRLWDKEDRESMPVHATDLPSTTQTNDVLKKPTTDSQLELLAKVLDTGGKINENQSVDTNRIGNVGAAQTTIAEPLVEDIMEETEQ